MTKKTVKKPLKVTRAFLLKVANNISSKNKFIRLCDGDLCKLVTLGKNKPQKMHCGLGELYFALTSNHPTPSIRERDVVDLVVKQSGLEAEHEARVEKVKAELRSLLSANEAQNAIDALTDSLDADASDDAPSSTLNRFRKLIASIPEENDDGEGDFISYEAYRSRARRVAKVIREAAKLLPE